MKNTVPNHRNIRNASPVIAIIGMALTMMSPAVSAQSSDPFYSTAASSACYRQANMAIAGENPDALSSSSCERALKNRPLSRQQKVAIWYDRAMIDLAKGKLERARDSLEMSTEYASEVGVPHLALAQLAFRQGDYPESVKLYQALLDSGLEEPALARNRQAIVNNQKMAVQAADNDRLAHHKP